MDLLHQSLQLLWERFGVTLIVLCVLTATEIALPRGKVSMRTRLSGALFWIILMPIMTLGYWMMGMVWHALGIRPLIVLPLRLEWSGVMAGILSPIAAAVIYDFFFYWFHRAQHVWLWRFHAVHHSIGDLNAINSYHHISEPLFQWIGILLPVSLIVTDSTTAIPVLAVLLHFHGSFIHSSTRFGFGPLRVIFCDNHFHRIHHSLEPAHFDRNFGAFTTLWDQLFGTAHFPRRGEWPATGIAGVTEPTTLAAWLALPWRLPPSEPAPMFTVPDRSVNGGTARAI